MYFCILIFCLLCLPFQAMAASEIETDEEANRGIGWATIWAIGKATDGGYLKLGMSSSYVDQEFPYAGELEGGWRIKEKFLFGMNLQPGFKKVTSLDSALVQVGFIFGYRHYMLSTVPGVFDLKIGSLDVTRTGTSYWFVQPGIHLTQTAMVVKGSRLMWSLGIGYRFVEKTSLGSDVSLNAATVNLDLAMGKY